MGRAAAAAERLLTAAAAELPDTAASMRLTGLEVTDCIQVAVCGTAPVHKRTPSSCYALSWAAEFCFVTMALARRERRSLARWAES